MAKKQAAKAKAAKTSAPVTASRADEAAEYIGESLADLMNRKDALVRQLANVNQRIASVSQMGSRLIEAVPRLVGLGRAKAAPKKTGNRKRKRPLPPDEPMVAQTERARAAEAKGRAAKRARTSNRSGNR